MELARAWCRSPKPAPPKEFTEALASHPDTAGFEAWDVIPELITPLPETGEGRNHDLAAIGAVCGVPTFIGVEAKAGEPFGDDTIGSYYEKKLGTTSGVPKRIAALVELLTGNPVAVAGDGRLPATLATLASRGYQLLTAAAGTALEARRRHCTRAVLVVHEFRPAAPGVALAANLTHSHEDLSAFAGFLLGDPSATVGPSTVHGPIPLPTSPRLPGGVALYIGKCTTVLV